jgi:hypothetical protein
VSLFNLHKEEYLSVGEKESEIHLYDHHYGAQLCGKSAPDAYCTFTVLEAPNGRIALRCDFPDGFHRGKYTYIGYRGTVLDAAFSSSAAVPRGWDCQYIEMIRGPFSFVGNYVALWSHWGKFLKIGDQEGVVGVLKESRVTSPETFDPNAQYARASIFQVQHAGTDGHKLRFFNPMTQCYLAVRLGTLSVVATKRDDGEETFFTLVDGGVHNGKRRFALHNSQAKRCIRYCNGNVDTLGGACEVNALPSDWDSERFEVLQLSGIF